MTKEELRELRQVLAGVAGNFGHNMNESTIIMWIQAFQADGITAEQIRTAAFRIMRVRKVAEIPTFAEFLGYIKGAGEDKASRQADEVIAFLRKHGRMRKPEFKDPITTHLMRVRWPYQQWAADIKEKEIPRWCKDFIAAYRDYAKDPGFMHANRQLGSDDLGSLSPANIGEDNEYVGA